MSQTADHHNLVLDSKLKLQENSIRIGSSTLRNLNQHQTSGLRSEYLKDIDKIIAQTKMQRADSAFYNSIFALVEPTTKTKTLKPRKFLRLETGSSIMTPANYSSPKTIHTQPPTDR